ncbi:hypothetical protein DDV21_001060 [Streptococcus chenjunshii]|uniref:Uncharacterized protein n=1 Tax=Streptococcus chenjunshii TaxID=2173853 RepID=A0A372KKB1_9STRE|nr:hypothetical protein [Streptococcus chenjunshii]AXQ77760.1 hypothetical protein DDV21_001060 [Streptococcus chenjunshii]RFU50482.1 hypothetical protein DDV22_08395 [Streptococcus chenjunshii]RFU52710.1 hypothetical protein DDV23_08235 [Streptococcus chenjunshii]
MPIDFSTMSPYSIDYNNLMKQLELFPIFTNFNLQKQYLNQWKITLKKADSNSTKILKQPNKLKALLNTLSTEESFQQQTIFGDNNIAINFNITPLIEIAKKNKQYASDIPLTYFEKSRKFVTWTPVPKTDSRTPKDLPILLVHFYNAQAFGFLLVDGNHRLSQATKNHQKTIKTLILRPNIMLNDNFFRSKFDKLFFIFQNELYYLYHCKKNHQMKDKELLSRSYLTNSKFNFFDVIPDLSADLE